MEKFRAGFVLIKSPTILMNTHPTVSVALCTCNGERFLRQQLDSIQSQSQPVNEIIICDDCSDDTTAEIVLEFAAETSVPVKWFRNLLRLGVTKNFEKAISLCSGEIIFLCDQDDRWLPQKVEILVGQLGQNPAAMAFSNAAVVKDDLTPLGYRLWSSIWFDDGEQQRVKSGDALPVLLRHAIAAGATLAFRSKYLPLILPIPSLPHSHDIWITLLLACVGNILPIDQDLIQYRLHGANQVGMREYGLLDQIRMARHQLKTSAFANLADLHEAAYARLASQDSYPVEPKSLALLQEKIRHSRLRHDMPKRWLSRSGVVLTEIRQRNYQKYSYGWKSVLQDLFLR
jgi:glycosyltransferase involved in cell wall biosynthesis